MAVPKPTFVLVPGAWHPVSCYNVLCEELSAAGYPVQVAELPSLDPRDPSAVSCAKDAEAVRKILISLIEEDKHVVVVPHSYGGIPGGCGAYGLGKSAREKEGKKGGVIGLIYMSAFVVPEGSSLLEFLGGKYPFYVQENTPSEDLTRIAPTRETLYNDVPEVIAESLERLLRPHGTKAFDSIASAAGWADSALQGRIAFLRCTNDQGLPTFLQDMFMQRSRVQWIVKDIDAGHSAFVSRTREVTDILTGWAADFS